MLQAINNGCNKFLELTRKSSFEFTYCTMQRSFAVSMNRQFQSGYSQYLPFELHRRWLVSERCPYYQNCGPGNITFNVMSYNILSQELLKRHMYLYRNSPREALDWEWRTKSIIREIESHNIDILCLQELDECDYIGIFKPQLVGYESLYKKKTGSKTDGCAIFFKKNLFLLEQHVEVEFKRPGEPLLNKDNIGLVALFQPMGVETKSMKFCVSTTHLLFNPKRGDIKLVQLRLLLAEIGKMSFRGISSANVAEYYPVILCGDFNSVPFSPLYNFITAGSICCENLLNGNISGQKEGTNKGKTIASKCIDMSSLGIDRENQYTDLMMTVHSAMGIKNSNKSNQLLAVQSENLTSLGGFADVKMSSSSHLVSSENSVFLKKCENEASCGDNTFYHHFNFVSAYKHFAFDGDVEVTTYHAKAKCTVDYIFYSASRKTGYACGNKKERADPLLTVLGVYSLFSTREIDLLGELPNWAYPSDHMCLITCFALGSPP